MSAQPGRGHIVPERLTLNGRIVDRRAFLGALGLAAAGSLLAARTPSGGAAPLSLRPSSAGAASNGTWHIDDMWGHWPRYAHPIPYTLARHVPMSWDNVAPVDRMFVT